jgi:hypothetical protein
VRPPTTIAGVTRADDGDNDDTGFRDDNIAENLVVGGYGSVCTTTCAIAMLRNGAIIELCG